jgi:DGQHR domain-containing protein
MADKKDPIRRRALRVVQESSHPLYMFSLTGRELLEIADISRLSRDDAGKLLGYQRSEVRKHVQDIVDYLDSDSVLFPNSIILAISSRVKFTKSRGPEVDDGCASAGTIEIPLPQNGDPKPAWIVDGQQRALALSKSTRNQIAVPVNAFVADEVAIQRDQFLRVNNTRPLPRGLITELLPEVSTNLPSRMAARRIPSAICEWLNQDSKSPFHGLIRRASVKGEDQAKAVIADSSLINMLQESLTSANGCLYPYRNIATGEVDFDSIFSVLVTYWTAVRNVFPDAWGKAPDKSRLMHGAGIRSMGRLMDKIMPGARSSGKKNVEHVERELRIVAPICRWTSGNWESMSGLRWNEVQNVPRHITMLSWVLIHAYLKAKGLA